MIASTLIPRTITDIVSANGLFHGQTPMSMIISVRIGLTISIPLELGETWLRWRIIDRDRPQMTRLEVDNWIVLISERNSNNFIWHYVANNHIRRYIFCIKALDEMKIVIGRWMENRTKIKKIEFYVMKVILEKNLKSVSVIEDLCYFDRQSRYNFRDFSS